MTLRRQVEVPLSLPEAEEAADEARFLLGVARNYSITTVADLQQASEERSRIKARYNDIEDLRKRLKDPVMRAARNIDDQFRQPLAQLTQAIGVIDDGIKAFHRRIEAERRQEEDRLRRLAREEDDRLRLAAAEAEKEGDQELVEYLEEEAAGIDTLPVVYQPTPKVAGLQMREYWTFDLVDVGKLPREYLMADVSKIRKVVEALKGECRIPGVRVRRDDIVAGGR